MHFHQGRKLNVNATQIYEQLTELFHDVFMRDDIVLTPELSAKDVEGWDSFKMIEIIIGVEERFSMKMNTREIDALKCVGDLVSVIERKIAPVAS